MNRMKKMIRGAGLVLLLAVFLAAWIVLPWPALLALAVAFALWMVLTRSGRQAASVTGVADPAPGVGLAEALVAGRAVAASITQSAD